MTCALSAPLALNLDTCGACDVIRAAWAAHGPAMAAALSDRAQQDDRFADERRTAGKPGWQTAATSAQAARAGHVLCEQGEFDAFRSLTGAGIIVFGAACKVSGIDAAKRTAIAVRTWES